MNPDKKEFNNSKENVSSCKMVFFDVDGTLVDNVSSYQEIGSKIGVGMWPVVFSSLGLLHEYQLLKQRFKTREQSSYREWTTEACGILKAHCFTEAKFLEIVARQPFTKGAKEAIEELKGQGYKTAAVTGGFGELARRVQRELGVDDVVAHCDLIFGADGRLEDWALLPCDYGGKIIFLERMATKYGYALSQCAYVGDGVNDIPVFSKVGLSVAANARKQEVRDAADVTVDGNLQLMLPYLGIAAK